MYEPHDLISEHTEDRHGVDYDEWVIETALDALYAAHPLHAIDLVKKYYRNWCEPRKTAE